MMMENRENSLDRELIGHLQHVQFGGQQGFHQMHGWGEFTEDRFSDGRNDVNGMEVRNKGPSPCNSQASLGYHSLPSSQCGSRPGSNPDYTVDYGTSSSCEQSATYLDSPLADFTDPCWRYNISGQSMDTSERVIHYGQNEKESIRRCIDMEWRNWCHQQQQNLQQNEYPCTGNSHHSNGHHCNGHHSNGIQTPVGMYTKRTSKQHGHHFVQQHHNAHVFQQRNHMHHSGFQNNGMQPSPGRWIQNLHNHRHSSPTRCTSRHQQRYDEPHGRVEMLSKSLTTCSQFRTCLSPEDPIYEEIVEHNIVRSNDSEEAGPNLPPRPKSWTSMVNLHQKSKAPVYYQIEPCVSHQHHDSCCKMQPQRIKTVLSPTNSLMKHSRGVCANATTADHYKRDDAGSINVPYFPYINRLFQEESEFSDISHEKDCKTNEKKSGKIEKFFGSLLSLNKSKGVKNMGTSTEEKTKDENNVDKHRKLRRTVSESCNIYSRGNGPTYEDDMCNLLQEIQINMKEIDHNSKKLHHGKDKRVKNAQVKTDKHGERRHSRREKKTDGAEMNEEKNERTHSHSNRRHQSGSSQSPRHYARNLSSGVDQSGVTHSVNHHAIKTVVNDSRPRTTNSTTESCHNKSQCSTSHRKSGSRPAMGVQALLTRSSNYSSPETTLNKSTASGENNADVDDSFERRLSHERTGSRLSFVYDYSEGSDSEESESDMLGVSGYASEAYAQGLASGEDNENWKEGDQVYGLPLAKPLFRNNVVATAKRRKLIEKVTEL